MRSTGARVRPVAGSEMAAAKLSTPICTLRLLICAGDWMTRLALWSHVPTWAQLIRQIAACGDIPAEHGFVPLWRAGLPLSSQALSVLTDDLPLAYRVRRK